MRHTIRFLLLIGMLLVSARTGLGDASPASNDVTRFPSFDPAALAAPRPYYVSEGLNGNEVYPPVELDSAQPFVQPALDSVFTPRGKGKFKRDGKQIICDCPPWIQFEFDWLNMSRDNRRVNRNLIGGPDAANFGDLNFANESGYRIRGTVGLGNWELEGVYSDLNPWLAGNTRQLTRGLAFDDGVTTAAAWLNQNFINQNTFFGSIFTAASGAAAVDEFDGLGPGDGVFSGDTPPSLVTRYWSELDVVEANVRTRSYVKRAHADWRFGVGFAHLTLDEFAAASMTGSFRAVDTGGGPFSGGLTHADLTTAGDLALISGPGTGFDDQTGGSQAPSPDTLTLLHEATVDNMLNGAQLLLDARLYQSQRIRISSSLKAGVYHNRIRGTIRQRYTEVTGDGDVYGNDLADAADQVAFLGTIGVAGSYGLRDWLHVRGGYELNFLSGVALAPDQNAVGSSFTVDTDGSLMTYGFNIGIEGRY